MKFRIMRPLLRAWRSRTYHPGMLGWSLGIGLFVGLSPAFGLQILLCIGICLLWNALNKTARLSMPIMILGSFVANPLTMAPLCLLYYQVGCQVLECRLRLNKEFFISLDSVAQLGSTIASPILLGSIPFMLIGLPLGIYLGNKAEKLLVTRRGGRAARTRAATAGTPSDASS